MVGPNCTSLPVACRCVWFHLQPVGCLAVCAAAKRETVPWQQALPEAAAGPVWLGQMWAGVQAGSLCTSQVCTSLTTFSRHPDPTKPLGACVNIHTWLNSGQYFIHM